jgi:hypothetical protein
MEDRPRVVDDVVVKNDRFRLVAPLTEIMPSKNVSGSEENGQTLAESMSMTMLWLKMSRVLFWRGVKLRGAAAGATGAVTAKLRGSSRREPNQPRGVIGTAKSPLRR